MHRYTVFLILSFRRVLNEICFLLGVSPASDAGKYPKENIFHYTVYLYLETSVGGVRQPQHTQTGSNSSTIAADSSNGGTNNICCR
jgi:hypothetical protein